MESKWKYGWGKVKGVKRGLERKDRKGERQRKDWITGNG